MRAGQGVLTKERQRREGLCWQRSGSHKEQRKKRTKAAAKGRRAALCHETLEQSERAWPEHFDTKQAEVKRRVHELVMTRATKSHTCRR